MLYEIHCLPSVVVYTIWNALFTQCAKQGHESTHIIHAYFYIISKQCYIFMLMFDCDFSPYVYFDLKKKENVITKQSMVSFRTWSCVLIYWLTKTIARVPRCNVSLFNRRGYQMHT